MRVLLVDTTMYAPTTPLFGEALASSKHEVSLFDEARYFDRRSLVDRIAYRALGRRPITYWAFNSSLVGAAKELRPDVVFVSKGAHVAAKALLSMKEATDAVLINYSTDDPFCRANSTPDLIRAIPHYDLYATPRLANMEDLRRAGAKHVTHTHFAYHPNNHFPEHPSGAEAERFASDVVFVGGADDDRVPYFDAISEIPNIKLALYGGYWTNHPRLRRYAKGFARGRDYRFALCGAKMSIGLVRRANRDGHVMRSFEVPACGTFMLAERTTEHCELFDEDKEAAYFDSREELVDKVRYYLSHDTERERIAAAGHRRVTAYRNTYADRFEELIALAVGTRPKTAIE